MTRRLVFWGWCVVLLVAFACKSEHALIPKGPACSYATTVVMFGGRHYLYIQYPDGPGTLVYLDEKPQSDKDAVLTFACPCELNACSEMCAQAAKQVGYAAACQVAPNTVQHPDGAPAPDAAPTKPAAPRQP